MTALRKYLLRLVFCGFFVSLAESLPLGKHARNALRLCGGCLLLIGILAPVLTLDGADLAGKLDELFPAQQGQIAAAKNRNEELLQHMVEEEAAKRIQMKVIEYGADLQVAVVAVYQQNGICVPCEVTLRGTIGEEARKRIEEYLTNQWEIPPSRQKWESP